MILGVAHVAISVHDLEAGRGALTALGYELQFMQDEMPNDQSKRPFMLRWTALHDISYFRPSISGPALEVISYPGAPAGQQGPDILVFAGPSTTNNNGELAAPAALAKAAVAVASAKTLFSEAYVSGLGIPCFRAQVDGSAHAARLCGVILPVADLDTSAGFWGAALGVEARRAKSVSGQTGWASLDVKAIHPSWSMSVALVEATGASLPRRFMDTPGCTTICLLSTDLARDRDRLAAFPGAKLGEAFAPIINSKRLKVCVGEAPCGELFELIQVIGPADARKPQQPGGSLAPQDH